MKEEKKKKIVIDVPTILEKMNDCCNEFYEVVGLPEKEVRYFDVPKCCDNRACEKQACKEHRGYQYSKNHSDQIVKINKSMRRPKAWVFTGWVVPLPIDRGFMQQKLRLLYKLLSDLKHGSITEFSIHMEVKIQVGGKAYLHFHVVTAGIKDLRFVGSKWGRVVRYQHAIKKESLADYISKYASKTPFFRNDDSLKVNYLKTVYKVQMHRFSVKGLDKIRRVQTYFRVEFLIEELKRAGARDYHYTRDGTLKMRDYHADLDHSPQKKEWIGESDLYKYDIKPSLSTVGVERYLRPKSAKPTEEEIEEEYRANGLID